MQKTEWAKENKIKWQIGGNTCSLYPREMVNICILRASKTEKKKLEEKWASYMKQEFTEVHMAYSHRRTCSALST